MRNVATPSSSQGRKILSGAGVGFKPMHVHDILEDECSVDWFEVHAENYMGAGGPPHFWLEKIRERYPLSVHGVGLSIGGAGGLDVDHLNRLKAVVDRYEPELVSEHLAWSTHQGQYFNDLMALPYTQETLASVVDHIDQAQTHLGRRLLIENPSTYIAFDQSDMHEADFVAEVVRQTGCGLLLDVNNAYVTCTNHGLDLQIYLSKLPLSKVAEIHLAGHAVDQADGQPTLLIDAHDRHVADPVWDLYDDVLQKTGPVATLIEWDNDVPDWPTLKAEAHKAGALLENVGKEVKHVV